MIGIIYCYTSPSNKVYIGQTTKEVERRQHFFNLNHHYGGVYIDNARNKYGPKNFKYEVLETLDLPLQELKTQLDKLEIYYIDKYKSNNKHYGYNLTSGGGTTLGYKFSEQAKKKMSIARKGRIFCKRTPEIQEKMCNSLYKKVEVLTPDGASIGVFKNIKEASEFLSASVSGLRNCIYRGNLYKHKYKIQYYNGN